MWRTSSLKRPRRTPRSGSDLPPACRNGQTAREGGSIGFTVRWGERHCFSPFFQKIHYFFPLTMRGGKGRISRSVRDVAQSG